MSPVITVYCSLVCLVCDARDGKPPNFATKAAMGITAGAIGSFIGTPAEISLIRMTADGRCVQFTVVHASLSLLVMYTSDKRDTYLLLPKS